MIRIFEMYSLSLSIIIRNMIRETPEDAAERYAVKDFNYSINYDAFIEGAKWQQERSISKEAYEDSLNMQRCSNAGYESKINELKSEIGRMYSEEEVYRTIHNLMTDIKLQGLIINDDIDLRMWFGQFKKK